MSESRGVGATSYKKAPTIQPGHYINLFGQPPGAGRAVARDAPARLGAPARAHATAAGTGAVSGRVVVSVLAGARAQPGRGGAGRPVPMEGRGSSSSLTG